MQGTQAERDDAAAPTDIADGAADATPDLAATSRPDTPDENSSPDNLADNLTDDLDAAIAAELGQDSEAGDDGHSGRCPILISEPRPRPIMKSAAKCAPTANWPIYLCRKTLAEIRTGNIITGQTIKICWRNDSCARRGRRRAPK